MRCVLNKATVDNFYVAPDGSKAYLTLKEHRPDGGLTPLGQVQLTLTDAGNIGAVSVLDSAGVYQVAAEVEPVVFGSGKESRQVLYCPAVTFKPYDK